MRFTTITLALAVLCLFFATACPQQGPPRTPEYTPPAETEDPATQPVTETETPLGTETETPVATETEPPAEEGLFNFYSLPPDWPKSVPIMSEFWVTEYENTPEGMHAVGHGAVPLIRANNFYTNARKEHVSSNIWELDPDFESVVTGDEQVFYYVGEGQKLVIRLKKIDDNNVSFELNYTPAE
mgnify:CR=1 FL=1